MGLIGRRKRGGAGVQAAAPATFVVEIERLILSGMGAARPNEVGEALEQAISDRLSTVDIADMQPMTAPRLRARLIAIPEQASSGTTGSLVGGCVADTLFGDHKERA
jgi:hypothetical protein